MDSPSTPPPRTRHRRRIKLIRPRLQLTLIGAFLGIATLALVLQFLVFASSLSEFAQELPQDGNLLMEALPGLILRTLGLSFVVLLPLIFSVGVLVTFRVAGPVHRLEGYLRQVARGEKPADCRLRRGDELQELCQLVNEATAPLREREDAGANAAPVTVGAQGGEGGKKAA